MSVLPGIVVNAAADTVLISKVPIKALEYERNESLRSLHVPDVIFAKLGDQKFFLDVYPVPDGQAYQCEYDEYSRP